MSRDSQRHYTVDDYFTVEEMSDVKHEFFNGEIFAMAGASLRHNEIAANVLTGFRASLHDSNCGVYGSDLRIQTPGGLYTYPDISVICGSVLLLPDRSDTATNPLILVEVLSEATEEYDRGEKFSLYQAIPTFRHYFLISQTEVRVDYHRRHDDAGWHLNSFRDRSVVISIPDLPLSLPVGEIYRRVF